MLQQFLDFFKPNKILSQQRMLLMIGFQIIVFLIFWIFQTSTPLLPKPQGIAQALVKLFTEDNFSDDLFASLWLSFEAMTKTIIFSLIISYATVMPFFKPIAFIISKFRFLAMVGLTFIFVLMTSNGHELKVDLLIFGVTVFFVTSMMSVLDNIQKSEYDYARTLGMNEWQVVWHVVIIGHLADTFEAIRQNFAMNYMMLTMVEGVSRSDGGIGIMLLNQDKHFNLDAVFAIQLVVLTIGITQDKIIGFIKDLVCPYAKMTLAK